MTNLLNQNKRDLICFTGGRQANIGFNGIFQQFPIYFGVNGNDAPSFNSALRRIALGVACYPRRVTANIRINTRPDATTVGIGFGIFYVPYVTVPAGFVGQVDSGYLNLFNYAFDASQLAPAIQKGAGVFGEIIQVERIWCLMEVDHMGDLF